MALNNRPATVFVVDDDKAVADSLRLLLRSVGLSAETFNSASDFLQAYQAERAGCLVLDVRMPEISGLQLQHELNTRGYTLPVIFISGHADVPMAVEAIKHGAFGFLQKPFRDQELLDHVKRALEHDEGIRAQLAERHRIAERLRTLTPRETEVFGLMTRGLANKAMAGELNVSQRTVEIHRSRVMEKMAAGSLAHLVRMSLELQR